MVKLDSDYKDVATEVDLTTEDLEAILRVKRKRIVQLRVITIIETFVGLISFLSGYNIIPYTQKTGYPFFVFSIVGSISLLSLYRKKSLFIMIIVTLVISLVGFMSGCIIGSTFKTTYFAEVNGTALDYGVYFKNK